MFYFNKQILSPGLEKRLPMKLKAEDLIEGVITGGVATFIKDAQEADVVLTF